MKYTVILFACILFFPSCNNSTEDTKPAEDSATTKIKDKTNVKVDSMPVTVTPTELATDEMQDDAVFADGSKPTSWKSAGIDDSLAFKRFLKHVQYWVANGQKDSVASVIAFPLRNPKIKSKEEFLKNYDTYINDKVKKALAAVNFKQLFRNNNGVMIGSGEMWFGQKNKRFAIIAINA